MQRPDPAIAEKLRVDVVVAHGANARFLLAMVAGQVAIAQSHTDVLIAFGRSLDLVEMALHLAEGLRAVGAAHIRIAHLAIHLGIRAIDRRGIQPPVSVPTLDMGSVSAELAIRPGPLLEQDHPSSLHALPGP